MSPTVTVPSTTRAPVTVSTLPAPTAEHDAAVKAVTQDRSFRLLRVALAANKAAVLWGPPGVGKTNRIEALCGALFPGLPLVTIIASLYDPTEFAGLPVVEGGVTRKAAPDWVDVLADAGGGVLFLDEVSTAAPAVQAALLRVVLDRVVGETPLPAGVRIVCAANPPDQAAGGWELSAPLANRLMHLDVACPEAGAWCDWLSARFTDTPERRRAAVLVGGFIRSVPAALHDLPATETERGRAWASPRSWHAAADLVADGFALGLTGDLAALVESCVGPTHGAAFSTYLKKADLPDPRALLAGTAAYTFTAVRNDAAVLVAESCAVEATQAAVSSAAERAALVEKAAGLILSACKAGCADYMGRPAATLVNWRNDAGGAKGKNEATVATALAGVLLPLVRVKAAADAGRAR
jgi:hypothetical protein